MVLDSFWLGRTVHYEFKLVTACGTCRWSTAGLVSLPHPSLPLPVLQKRRREKDQANKQKRARLHPAIQVECDFRRYTHASISDVKKPTRWKKSPVFTNIGVEQARQRRTQYQLSDSIVSIRSPKMKCRDCSSREFSTISNETRKTIFAGRFWATTYARSLLHQVILSKTVGYIIRLIAFRLSLKRWRWATVSRRCKYRNVNRSTKFFLSTLHIVLLSYNRKNPLKTLEGKKINALA